MSPAGRTDLLVEAATRLGVTIAGLSVFVMMLVGAADVVGTFFNAPIAGAFELIELLMVLVIFMALPETQRRGQHIRVDLIYRRLPAQARALASGFALLLGLGFYAAMAWQAWKLFWESWLIREYASGSVAFPVYVSKGLFALGVTVLVVVMVVDLLSGIKERKRRWT